MNYKLSLSLQIKKKYIYTRIIFWYPSIVFLILKFNKFTEYLTVFYFFFSRTINYPVNFITTILQNIQNLNKTIVMFAHIKYI